jgi:YggT family protein
MPATDYIRTFVSLLLNVLHLAILARVLLSWFPMNPGNPIVRSLHEITEPVLAPFRRIIPRLGMFDLSPLAALLVSVGGYSSIFFSGILLVSWRIGELSRLLFFRRVNGWTPSVERKEVTTITTIRDNFTGWDQSDGRGNERATPFGHSLPRLGHQRHDRPAAA